MKKIKLHLNILFPALLLFHLSFSSAVAVPVDLDTDGSEPSFLSPLRARGFSLIPSPQQLDLGSEDVFLDGSWGVESKLGKEDIAEIRLIQGAAELHNLTFNATGKKRIVLSIQAGTVKGSNDAELNKQGYLLKITTDRVDIIGNDHAGLFYGVQSLLQLLRNDPAGRLVLPELEIRDWPSLQLRFVHWDTKHHQKRIETMKRLIDWHAFFKVNMISFEMEDKYEYPSHPIIGAPGAYTKAQMHELTQYAMERHIQLVPNVQAPAHMAFVLKHEEFAHLRSDGSNFQACMCDPEALDLIFDMYQDMIDATPGVEYFHVSTDEVYYAGICSKCPSTYNEENRSLAWAEFAIKARDWLAQRGRRMVAWVEYPLLEKDISLIPSDIINSIGGNESFTREEIKIGMQQLSYSSTQGSELLFPNHFATQYRNRETEGRLENNSKAVRDGLAIGAKMIGTFAAAWDDAGLHEETFHLGWATVAQYGWTPYGPTVDQTVADFMDVFYGSGSPDMEPVYQALMEGARFFEGGWDLIESKERGKRYGNSRGKGIGGESTDEILVLPEIPASQTLRITDKFNERYRTLIAEAEEMKGKSDDLLYKLTSYAGKVERNRYNLEVFLSIAYMEHYFIRTVLTLRDAEEELLQAESAVAGGKHSDAVTHLTEASNKVGELIAWSDWMWENVIHTWEKSRFEKGASIGGRDFLHVLDDVKDHSADRRAGLDYLIAPFQRLDLPAWRARLNERTNQYAETNNVKIKGRMEDRLED